MRFSHKTFSLISYLYEMLHHPWHCALEALQWPNARTCMFGTNGANQACLHAGR